MRRLRALVRRIGGEVQPPAAYSQARLYLAAVCKTVGSAHVGSNPTPATAAETPSPGEEPLRAVRRRPAEPG
jgi:hypothetical protein